MEDTMTQVNIESGLIWFFAFLVLSLGTKKIFGDKHQISKRIQDILMGIGIVGGVLNVLPFMVPVLLVISLIIGIYYLYKKYFKKSKTP